MSTNNAKTARLEVRMSSDIANLINRAVEISGLTKTGFITSVLQQAAEKIVRDQEVLALSLEDQKRFADALIDPPEPNDAMRRAFSKRNELLVNP